MLAMKKRETPLKNYYCLNGNVLKDGFPIYQIKSKYLEPTKPSILDELEMVVNRMGLDHPNVSYDYYTSNYYIAVTREAWVSTYITFRYYPPEDFCLSFAVEGRPIDMAYRGFDIHGCLHPNTIPRVQMKRINRTFDDTQPRLYILPRFMGLKP